MTLNNYRAVAAIAGMLVLGIAGTALAEEEAPADRALKGTWLVQVQQRICATQEPLGDTFFLGCDRSCRDVHARSYSFFSTGMLTNPRG